ncbi:MAG: helix-turn-helix domain-containing protein [Trichodesmium sp. MO_231.B1]|nr:helix-turn-helix domain-containing protein [Trichodesmium sp. MO_231.B1]
MPIPKAQSIILSPRQKSLLQLLASQTTNSYRLVRRVKLILAAASGTNNTAISEQLQLHRRQVRQWRKRWLEASEQLASAETQQVSDKKLRKLIEDILSDAPRPGTTKFIDQEQVVQIVAMACEDPKQSQRPVSHWTPRELAEEAIERRIVEKISPRSVGRFLKGSDSTTSSSSLLVKL